LYQCRSRQRCALFPMYSRHFKSMVIQLPEFLSVVNRITSMQQDATKNSYMRSCEEIHRRDILQIFFLTVRRHCLYYRCVFRLQIPSLLNEAFSGFSVSLSCVFSQTFYLGPCCCLFSLCIEWYCATNRKVAGRSQLVSVDFSLA